MKLTSPNDRSDPDVDVEKYDFGVDHYVKRRKVFFRSKGHFITNNNQTKTHGFNFQIKISWKR